MKALAILALLAIGLFIVLINAAYARRRATMTPAERGAEDEAAAAEGAIW